MNKTQRGIGIIYATFASWVFISAIINRFVFHKQIFSLLDLITIACIVFFFLSIFIDKLVIRIVQIVLICMVALSILSEGEMYLPLMLFINAFFVSYSYGWFNKKLKTKILFVLIGLYSLYFAIGYNKGDTPLYQVNLFIFLVIHISSLWFVFRSTVEKAKHFDASKEIKLSTKLDEAQEELIRLRVQLDRTQRQLTDAIETGMELLEITKDIKNGR